MANILYFPQLSMYDKQTKELLPAADGNVNMMRNTIMEWKKHRPDDNFYILLPKNVVTKLSQILPSGTEKAYPLFYINHVISARINRYNFPMNEFINSLDGIKIDLIVNDVIELTPNFRQMFKIKFGYEPKIISNIRHVDEGLESDYILSVLNGIIKSDLTTILSESMKPKLLQQIQKAYYNRVMADDTVRSIHVFEPSTSMTQINSFIENNKKEISDDDVSFYPPGFKVHPPIIITFPGRMSKGEEKRTNWDKFIEAINKLRKIRQDFEVYFTDPNNAINPHYVEAQDWIHTINKDRNEFLHLLHKTDIIVSLMNVEGFGGISIREALLFGCRPIIPYVDEYKKMAEKSYDGYVYSPIEIDDLVERLDWAIDKAKKFPAPNRWTEAGEQFTIEYQFKKLLPKLEELLDESN